MIEVWATDLCICVLICNASSSEWTSYVNIQYIRQHVETRCPVITPEIRERVCMQSLSHYQVLGLVHVFFLAVTPQDYQPPGFREADGDTMEFEHEPVKLTMGQVATPFHSVKFDMATEKRRLEQVNEQNKGQTVKTCLCMIVTFIDVNERVKVS